MLEKEEEGVAVATNRIADAGHNVGAVQENKFRVFNIRKIVSLSDSVLLHWEVFTFFCKFKSS